MKYLVLLPALSALVLTNLTVAADEPQKDKEGFVSLFNGKDFSGWVNMGQKAGWSIKDSVIHSAGETGGNWLRSEKQYKNFILKVEWRVSQGGNSGVFIRSAEKGLPWTTGYEVQITNAPRDDAHCTGSLYGYAAVNPRPDESHDTWHRFEIQCHNHHIRVLADGVKCVDFDQASTDKTKGKPLAGYIGLQDAHVPKGHYIEYRMVKLKELD